MTIEKYVADYAKDLDHRLQASAKARIEPPPPPPSSTPLPPPKLDPSDPLYAIKALNHAQKVFRDAVDTTLSSNEVVESLHNTANHLTRSAVRSQMTKAANQTMPSGGQAMYNALRR